MFLRPHSTRTTHSENTLLRCSVGLALTLALGLSACAKTPQDILAEARELQSQGRIEESIPILRGLIDSGDREGETLYRYGRALSLTGQPGRGIWALDAALTDPAWFVRASHQIALDAYRGKNLDLTLETLERLRAERGDSHSEDLEALLLELRVRVETRVQFDEALELAETILDDYPDEERAIRLKAAALIGLKQTDEAYELIRDAGLLASGVGGMLPEDRPEEPQNAEGEEADEDAGSVLDLAVGSSEREAYWCTVRATFKREVGEPEEAAQILDSCLEQFPSNIALLNEAIKLYAQMASRSVLTATAFPPALT